MKWSKAKLKATKPVRRKAKTDNTEKLLDAGIKFDSRNSGSHLIIIDNDVRVIDFWPSTHLWIDRLDGRKYYGVELLIKYLKF